jgi:hypothetical protein
MGKKSSLGFPTQKEAFAAVRAIVNQYGLEQEFFHPLIQRLFIEQPYWCDPPGPAFTKFKWTKHELPNGATTERWFMCFLERWQERSWRKAIAGPPSFDRWLQIIAREAIMPIVSAYRDTHPICEHCKSQGRIVMTAHVHHTVPMKQIVHDALSKLTAFEHAQLAAYFSDGGVNHNFSAFSSSFPQHEFISHVVWRHTVPGLLIALCVDHHYEVEGKTNRKRIQTL